MGADHASRKALLGHDMVWSKPAADAQQQGSAGSSNPPAQAAAQQDSAGSSKSPEQAASQQDRAGSMRDFLRSTAAVRARRAAQQHGSPSSSKFPAQAPQDGAGSSNPPGLAPRTGSFLQRLAAGRAGSNKFAVESPAQKQTRLQYMLESAAPSTSPSTNPSTSPQHKPPAQPVVLMFDVCHLTAGGIFPATYAFERSMGFLAHALDAGVRVTKVVYIHDGRDPSKHPAPGMVVRDADLTCGLVKLIGEDGARRMSTVLGQERFEQLDQLTFQQSPTSADYSITFYAGHWASQGYRVIVIGDDVDLAGPLALEDNVCVCSARGRIGSQKSWLPGQVLQANGLPKTLEGQLQLCLLMACMTMDGRNGWPGLGFHRVLAIIKKSGAYTPALLVASPEYEAAATGPTGRRADTPTLNGNFYCLTAAPVAVPLDLRSCYEDAEYVMRLPLHEMHGLEPLRRTYSNAQLSPGDNKQLVESLRAVWATPPGQATEGALLREWARLMGPFASMPRKGDLDRVLRGVC